MAYQFNGLEKAILFALKAWGQVKKWLDRDKDGDLDVDDLAVVYRAVVDFITEVGPKIKGWPGLTTGERIDAALAFLKTKFPSVKTSLWVILEGLAYLALMVKGQIKK